MNQGEWDEAITALDDAANRVAVLSRCLDVGPHLRRWSEASTPVEGATAADGLDQARGDLERLAAGGAADLVQLVERFLEVLPTPLE